MDTKIIQFPAPDTAPNNAPAHDPVAERAAFFFDLEVAELTAIVPQAEAAEPRAIY